MWSLITAITHIRIIQFVDFVMNSRVDAQCENQISSNFGSSVRDRNFEMTTYVIYCNMTTFNNTDH